MSSQPAPGQTAEQNWVQVAFGHETPASESTDATCGWIAGLKDRSRSKMRNMDSATMSATASASSDRSAIGLLRL